MRILALALSTFLAATSAAAGGVDTQFMQGLGDTRHERIESQELGRGYHLYVMLPRGYEESSEQSYPTLYVLDGGGLFPLFSSYYRYLNFGEEIPEMIIVGISYGSDSFEGGNYRSTDFTAKSDERDYYGGAGTFQTFLAEKLLPRIEKNYRSDPTRRMIFGQSIGGQFVLYTALTKPGLFWGHIASNPALHRNLAFFLEEHGESYPNAARPRLFVASGTMDVPRFREPALQWMKHWSEKGETPWDLKVVDLEGHSHMSAPPASFREGMRWLFPTEVKTD